ncbi:MAG: nucleotidyltransferase [Thermales bacterium]|nr:nucleotidyltransferase [Thermales bacterium]
MSHIIKTQFAKFFDNIKLTKNQKKDARTKYTGVCKCLHDNYYTTEYSGSTKLLIGSYGKKTNIRPARDIDIIFKMPAEKFDQYDDNTSNKQSQLLNDIKCVLRQKYSDESTEIKADGKVVKISFTEGSHDVEVVPAWENEDGTFKIPDSTDGGSWEDWDPRGEMKKISESEKKTKKTRMLIKMVKKWSEICKTSTKSYQIENAVVEYFDSIDEYDVSYSEMVKEFFGYFTLSSIESHIETANKRAKKQLYTKRKW